MTRPAKIRRITENDLQAVAAMVAAANREELREPFNEVDDTFLAETITPIVEMGMGVIAERRGTPIGLCAFMLTPLWYNPRFTTAASFLRYIVPEARSNGVGSRMLVEAEQVARGMGAHAFLVGVRARDQRVSRAILESGYRLLESYYTREL